jgi:hypothetical protein
VAVYGEVKSPADIPCRLKIDLHDVVANYSLRSLQAHYVDLSQQRSGGRYRHQGALKTVTRESSEVLTVGSRCWRTGVRPWTRKA